MNANDLISHISDGRLADRLLDIYLDSDKLEYQTKRYIKAVKSFVDIFGYGNSESDDIHIVSAPGRTEVGGNHTDHQHGQVLAASINDDAIAVVSKNDSGNVTVKSEGYDTITFPINDIKKNNSEEGTTLALIKGVIAGVQDRGFKVGGFDAYITSDVLGGSGLSSSAAFETVIGNILSALYNDMKIDAVTIAIIGQYAEKFRKLLDYEPIIEVADGLTPDKEAGSLKLSNVSFRYPNTDKDTLKDISIEIKPGEKIAIVGENGAGKTTFVKLLMRLYDVTDGSIEYNGHDIREYNTKAYRKKISAVFQDYNIYAATLAENVLLRQYNKEDEKDVIAALKKADFSKKLSKLPDGIFTNLTREFSDEGVNLSGGESQKIAISRVFLNDEDRAISILDEPSSALDPVSEYKLNKNLIDHAQNDTVIFISHRLSTTRMADRIYLFEHGSIIEQGSHEELMQLNGRYREMFDRQAKNYIS